MTSLEITTAIGCKVNCRYCPQITLLKNYRSRESQDRLLSLERFKLVCDKLPTSVAVRFAGFCEPWLNPACTDMVLYASETAHPIGVYTTLVGMTAADVKRLVGVTFTTFGVHLPSQEGTESIPVSEAYLCALKALLWSGIKCTFHCHGTAVDAALEPLGIKADFTATSTRASNLKQEATPFTKEAPSRRLKGRLTCERLRHNVLLPNGDVVLCCMDYSMKHVIGNLLTGTYTHIHNSDEFKMVQQGLKDESSDILCRDCDMFAKRTNLLTTIHDSLMSLTPRRLRSDNNGRTSNGR
jgi:Iron-sulfur cluster-binding domain